MFTKDEIQEIQRKLELSGKKLSQLPLVTEILEEDLLPILQKKENKSTTAGSYSLFVQNQILPKIEKLIEASTGEIKSSLLEVYKNLLLNSEDNKNEIIEAINDLKAIVNKENKVTLTVTSDTQDARIYLNGREQSSITVEQDSIVSLVSSVKLKNGTDITDRITITSNEGSCGVSSAMYCNEKGEVIVRISECVCFVVTPSITSSTSDCAKLTTSCDCYGHAQKI